MRDGAFEQGGAKPAATIIRQDREPDFGEVVLEGDMRDANQDAPVILGAENGAMTKVDSVDVGGESRRRERRTEPQAAVPRGERQKILSALGSGEDVSLDAPPARHRLG